MNSITAYPLCWPANQKRVPLQQDHWRPCTGSVTQYRDEILFELIRLQAYNFTVSTNVQLDGHSYTGISSDNDDHGAAVYFTYNRIPRVIACDRWSDVRDNLQAISNALKWVRQLPETGMPYSIINIVLAGSIFEATPPIKFYSNE